MTDTNELYETAADWHERVEEGRISPAEHAALQTWLAADPRHTAAFRAMDRMWSQMGEARTDPRILGMRKEALSASAAKRSPRAFRRWSIAAVIFIGVGTAFFAAPSLQFKTAIGERSNVTLADGSAVVLNTSSRIEVVFNDKQRRLRLLAGQAWFQVAKDSARPFVVDAGDQRIVALGTAFDVRLGEKQDSVQVTLMEGRVSVQPIQPLLVGLVKAPPAAAELAPGESLVISDNGSIALRPANVARVGSWRQGQIVFDNDTLGNAVEEVNRYSATRIVLADPALAALRVSGVFEAGRSQSFIETVAGHYSLQVAERTEDRIVLARQRAY